MTSFPGGYALDSIAALMQRPIPVLICSAIVAALLTPLVIRGAHSLGWLAHPRSDRWHSRVVALMGGVAIVGTILLMAVGSGVWLRSPVGIPLVIGMLVLAVLGAIDDRGGVNPGPKLLIETGVGMGIVAAGLRFGPGLPDVVSIPLTIIWIIGVTNAMNLLDNMDGLAAGTGVVVGGVVALISIQTGDVTTALISAAVTGACLGYLPYNYRRARVFMGDTGSLPLGFVVATLALSAGQSAVSHSSTALWGVAVPVLLCALPLIDTTLVTISRLRSGRAVSQGGRDHASHRLVYLGLADTAAVLLLHLAALSVALCAVIGTRSSESATWLGAAGVVASLAFLIWLLRIDPYTHRMTVVDKASGALAHIEPHIPQIMLRSAEHLDVPEAPEGLPRRTTLVRRAN